jgi:DHA2 family multidrug resistance protein
VTAYNVSTRQMLDAATAGFVARGVDATTAARMAYEAVFGVVARNASMMAFIDVFRLLGILFLCNLPLILLMRKPKHHGGGASMAH